MPRRVGGFRFLCDGVHGRCAQITAPRLSTGAAFSGPDGGRDYECQQDDRASDQGWVC